MQCFSVYSIAISIYSQNPSKSQTTTATTSSSMSQTTTITTPSSTLLALNALKTPPLKLSNSFDDYPKLTREECGHLRHFHNLVSLPDGEWSHMGAQESGQEWDTAFRYQIATMGYAVGAAHYHRLPAMRAVFKKLLLKVINKMLRREVWGYWFDSSHSGPRLDPDLKELRKPWADPVCKENIMVHYPIYRIRVND